MDHLQQTSGDGVYWNCRFLILFQNRTSKGGPWGLLALLKFKNPGKAQFSSVQSLSRVDSLRPMNCSTPGLSVHHQLPEFTQTHVHRVGDAIQPSHPLSSPSPPAPNPSQHQGLFQWVNSWGWPNSWGMRWPKYWSFSFSISPSNEHPGLISFRMDWLDLLAVQGTLRSLLNTTVQKHQFFGAQLSSQSNSHIHTWALEKP